MLQRWCRFKDEKARERIVESHLRMVPPIARNAAYKAGFQPNYEMMPGGGVKWTAALGFNEVVSDLTAAGNLGLMLAVEGYRLGQQRQVLHLRSNSASARDLETGHILAQRC